MGLIIFFGSFNQGFAGFGLQITIIPLLTLFIDIKHAVPLGALCGLIINIYLFLKLKRHIDFSQIWRIAAGALIGIPIGVMLLKLFHTEVLKPLLGIVILIFVIFNSFSKIEVKTVKKIYSYLTGLISGLFGGLFNTNGPPVLIYFLVLGWDKEKIKASITGYFLFSTTYTIIMHALTGLTTIPILHDFAIMIPFTIAGILLGDYLFKFISSVIYKRIIMLFLSAVSILLIIG